jgi:type IV secretion system protein VirD4
MYQNDEQSIVIWLIVLLVLAVLARRRWQPSSTAFGTACWASDKVLKAAGMLGNSGLILGRTLSGKLIRTANYCHVLLVGATGSGKGVSIIIPNLLSYFRGSVVCFDTKGDLYAVCRKRRAGYGRRVIRLAPFSKGTDTFNPLETIREGSPMLIDSARAMAEALVVRQGSEPDPHWNDKSAQVICAVLVLVLMRFEGDERSLNAVQEIVSDPKLLASAAAQLRKMGGLPARLGNQLSTLFESEPAGTLTKEGASVLSTVGRHLSFLDSELVEKSTARSTFDPACLLKPGTTLFLQIPPSQLEAQRGLLRCWISTLVRIIGAAGDERAGEVLFLLDEASALGSLFAVEEALVRGRSAGVRMLLAYQSDSQVRAAFKDKPTLLYDNCGTQIYLGPASSLETAERLSKSLGDYTQVLEGYGENASSSWNEGGPSNHGTQINRGNSFNYSVNGRALLRPEEVLGLSDDYLIAFQRGMAPILARRIKYYEERGLGRVTINMWKILGWGVMVAALAFGVWASMNGY